jgi:hypothetical protein
MNRHLTTALAVTCAAALITVAAGCGSSSSAEVPTGADMKGTWTSTGSGYENGKAVTWQSSTIIIDKAVGQAFSGNEKYTASGGVVFKEPIQGVIAPDGDILIVEEDGFYEGTLENGVFTGQDAEIGDEPTAMNVTLTKK